MKKLLFSLCALTLVNTASQAETIFELAKKCAPDVATDTVLALVKTESSFNPFAIGVVGGSIAQPSNLEDALAAVEKLEREGKNYSIGLGQINRGNFKRLNVDARTLFDPCENLQASQIILSDAYQRTDATKSKGARLADAMSMYYSGNTTTGYEHGYVDRIAGSAEQNEKKVPSVKLMTDYMKKSSSDEKSVITAEPQENTSEVKLVAKTSSTSKTQKKNSELFVVTVQAKPQEEAEKQNPKLSKLIF